MSTFTIEHPLGWNLCTLETDDPTQVIAETDAIVCDYGYEELTEELQRIVFDRRSRQ